MPAPPGQEDKSNCRAASVGRLHLTRRGWPSQDAAMFLNPEIVGLSPAAILFAALIIDAVFGEFGPLFRVIPHPVAIIGGLVGWFDRRLNREHRSPPDRG